MAKSIKLKNSFYWDIQSLGGRTMTDYSGSLNDLVTSGFYATNSNATNQPTNTPYYVIVISKNSTNYVLQIAIERNNTKPRVYMRIKANGNAFGDWGNITSRDIVDNNFVAMQYLGQDPDIDTFKRTSGIYGLYNCTKAPNWGIGVLEVLCYSGDWVIQRFTTIEQNPRMWERAFYSGTTWGAWRQRW